jgi:hypothetical protein
MNMSVQEIEYAITQLAKNELNELVTWLQEYRHALWDEQIAGDLDAGRLDSVITAAENDYQSGSANPL